MNVKMVTISRIFVSDVGEHLHDTHCDDIYTCEMSTRLRVHDRYHVGAKCLQMQVLVCIPGHRDRYHFEI